MTVGCALMDSDAILVCFTRQRMKTAWTFSYGLNVVRGTCMFRVAYNTGINIEIVGKPGNLSDFLIANDNYRRSFTPVILINLNLVNSIHFIDMHANRNSTRLT